MPTWTPTTRRVSLRKLFPAAKFHGTDDIVVESVVADSRDVEPDDLFVAVSGIRTDGHLHVREALARGANAVLAERLVPRGGKPLCIVPDSRVALARVCQALMGDPSRHMKVIGVTGTNGKTTTAWLIRGILEAAGHRTGLLGTVENCDGQWSTPSQYTTPPAPELAAWLGRMEEEGCSHAVMEVSSHALSQARLEGVQLAAACVTNVRHDHLDFHNTLANYREAKAGIFKHLAADGFAVLNTDDPGAAGLVERVTGAGLTVGMRGTTDVTAMLVERTISEQTFLLSAGSETLPVRTRMIGDHHISNCLVAAAVGLVLGIELADIARGLEQVSVVPGRLERIECGQSFGVFVDYAHTPDALGAVLETLREVTPGRLITVFGAGGERDRAKRPLMARAVEQAADLAILTQDNPRREPPQRIVRDLLKGCRRPHEVEVISDRSEAIAYALSQAEAGDCVLIAGKGHETRQIVGARALEHDDREVACRWLYENSISMEMLVPARQRQRAA
jgi:UDP-N-acetylmuramoyl-L-alanyl-D-glutamate--2,6-diaminopimelate ligase